MSTNDVSISSIASRTTCERRVGLHTCLCEWNNLVTGDLNFFQPHTLPLEYSPINVDFVLAKDRYTPQTMPYIPSSSLVECDKVVTGDLIMNYFHPHTPPPEYSPVYVDLTLAKDGPIPKLCLIYHTRG